MPRDVIDKVVSTTLQPIDDEKNSKSKEIIPLQSGTNKFASQKGFRKFSMKHKFFANFFLFLIGQTGFGTPRDAVYKPKGSGGVEEVPEEKARMTEGIIPLQSGTNKLASQAGMTGFGMPR